MKITIKELKEICKKEEQPPFERMYRKFSIYITWLFIQTSLSPNQATAVMLCVGLCADLCFLFPSRMLRLLGAFMYQCYYLLDLVDGDVARFRKRTSATGIYFDYFTHYLVHPMFYFCLGYGLYQESGEMHILLISFLCSYSLLLVDLNYYCKLRTYADHISKDIKINSECYKRTNRKGFALAQKKNSLITKARRLMNLYGNHFFVVVELMLVFSIAEIVLYYEMGTRAPFFLIMIYFYGVLYTLLWLKVFFSSIIFGIENEIQSFIFTSKNNDNKKSQ